MGSETHEKQEEPQRSAERQPEHTKQAQSEANAGSQNYADQVKAYRLEQKLSGKSKATGAGADAYGNGGLASAKDLLGDLAHGHPMLIADKLEQEKVKKADVNEKPRPQDGKDYSLKEILEAYKTPFMDAYEHSKHLKDGDTGKSKTLEQIVDRLKSCPWADRIRVSFDSRVGNPEYDPVKSTITIRPQDSPADQIELFVHEGFHSTHQALKEMYMGEKPLEPKQYAEVLGSLEARSFQAEIGVHNELTAKMGAGPVSYEWRNSKNEPQPTKNLGQVYAEKGLDGLKHFVLDEAFTDMKFDGKPHSWNYRTYYEATQPKYAVLWQTSHDELNKRMRQDPTLKKAIEAGGF